MQVGEGRLFIGRFRRGEDLLRSLTDFCRKEKIKLGTFSLVGALNGVKLGYYNQEAQKYTECVSLEKKLEITSCIGNISMKDSDIFVHAHITLADLGGHCYGGHLMGGGAIFAAEYHIRELTGAELKRTHDPETGLSLW